jgi:hypothetical protein
MKCSSDREDAQNFKGHYREKWQLLRPGKRREDNIKMNLTKTDLYMK